MRIGRLTIERKADLELAKEYREGAAKIRRGGLGKVGEHEARRAERLAEKLEKRAAGR